MKAQTVWEYTYVYFKTRTDDLQIEVMLNDMGSRGWELVSVVFGTGSMPSDAMIHGYFFKRPRL
jgi:hypothetical protein